MFAHKLVPQTSTYSSDWPPNRTGVWVAYEDIQFSCMFKEKKIGSSNFEKESWSLYLGKWFS